MLGDKYMTVYDVQKEFGFPTPDLVVADHEGARWLAIPFVTLAEYLAIPRWYRWTFYLHAAILVSKEW